MKIDFEPENTEQTPQIDFVPEEKTQEQTIDFVPEDNSPVLTGGVSQKVRTYWDKKGRIHYENEDKQPKMSWGRRFGRRLRAKAANANSWINETNPNSEAYKEKVNTILTLETLPFGIGKTAAQWTAAKLTPYLGRVISKRVAEGAGAGLVGGGLYGGLSSLIEGENPVMGSIGGAFSGALGGGLLNGLGGKAVQIYRGNKLKNMPYKTRTDKKEIRKAAKAYYKDYIQQTNINRKDLGKIYLGDEGLQETLNHHVKNSLNFPKLKDNISNADYIREELPRHPRKDDIVKFHRLQKDGEEYFIGETSKGKKYYLSKNTTLEDLTANTEDTSRVVFNNELETLPRAARTNPSNNTVEPIQTPGPAPEGDITLPDNKTHLSAYQNQPLALDKGANNIIADNVNDFKSKAPKFRQAKLTNADNLPDEIKQGINPENAKYQVIHNNDLIQNAQAAIQENPQAVENALNAKFHEGSAKLLKTPVLNAQDIENARQLVQKYFAENTDESLEKAIVLTEKLAQEGSRAGQAVQAMSLWNNSSPEGFVKYAQKLVNRYNQSHHKKVKLDNEFVRGIKESAEEMQALPEGREKDVATALIFKDIQNKLPKSWQKKMDTYRYTNMLLSPKSRVKDFLLTGVNSVEDAVDESIANVIDWARSKTGFKGSNRVYARLAPRVWSKNFKRGFKEGIEDVKLGINTNRSGETGRYGVQRGEVFNYTPWKQIRNPLQALENIAAIGEKGLNYSLQVPDRAFYEARYASSLDSQMKAAGVNEPTQDMINQAMKEAKEAVFQDDSWVSQVSELARKGLNLPSEKIEDFLNLGEQVVPRLGDAIMPFVSTPANIANAGLKNTFGAIPGAAKLIMAKTPGEIRDAEMLIAKNIKGAIPIGLGYMAADGAIKGNINNDNYQADEVTGLRPQSVVIGDKAFSLKDLPRWTIPMAVGAGLRNGGLSEGIVNAGGAVSEMSALKSLGDLVKTLTDAHDQELTAAETFDNVLRSQGANLVSQFVPYAGWQGEIRNDIDPYSRELYTPNTGQYILNRLQNRIPFASQHLPIKYNAIGEPAMVNNIQNPVLRALSESVDLGVRNYNQYPTYDALNKLQDEMKDTNILGKTQIGLKKAKRSIDINGEKVKLNNRQYSQFQKDYGRLNYILRDSIVNDPSFSDYSNEEKTKYLTNLRQSIEEAVKIKQFNHTPTGKLKPYTEEILQNYDDLIGE